MKRLIALLCAAIFSIFAGIEFILPKDDNFYLDSSPGAAPYFKVNEAGEVDYRSLYSSVKGFDYAGVEMCDTAQRQDTRDEWVELSTVGAIWQGLYSPVAEGKYTSETLTTKEGVKYTISVDEDVNITAPAAGEINTSHFANDYGSSMEFVIKWSDGNVFTMTISDAKCWYCCAGKKEPEDGLYQATTSDSLKGKSMRAGDVLCVGNKGTTITIVRAKA